MARRTSFLVLVLALAAAPTLLLAEPLPLPAMHWADTSRGRPFSKDPAVVRFRDRTLRYYSVPPAAAKSPGESWAAGWCIGNGAKDAICHAWSDDGVTFTRDPSNPIFASTGAWTAGRAIAAEIFPVGDRLLLFFATRDPAMKIQLVGVAGAPLTSNFSREHWRQLVDGPVLKPTLPWERNCIEAPTVLRRGDMLFLFYAGGYNNAPQQIGVATSRDGLTWTRLSDQPLLANGAPDAWNASESGHPGVFTDAAARTCFTKAIATMAKRGTSRASSSAGAMNGRS